MKVLVTGGAGFIGKYLVKSLLEKGNSVTIFDNFSNSTKNSIDFLVNTGAKVIEGDITKLDDIVNAIKDHEIVIHLAAKISVSESINNPSETYRVNVNGTNNILIACEKNNIKKLIVSSSAAVYGESFSEIKWKEESTTNPISPYGQSKVQMEQNIREFASKRDINYIILRFFNIYGIGQSSEYAGVITKFIKRIADEKPLEIFGDGLQTRDFVAIYDVIDAIHNASLYKKNGIFNIASGKVITIKKLAEQIILLSGKKLEMQFVAKKKGDIKHSQADITIAKNHLGYSPKFELKEMIKELLNK
jgi:UDP-glucose 4-epimerase